MFQAFFQQRSARAPGWAKPLVAGSVVLHVGVAAVVAIYYSWYRIEKLDVPRVGVVRVAVARQAPSTSVPSPPVTKPPPARRLRPLAEVRSPARLPRTAPAVRSDQVPEPTREVVADLPHEGSAHQRVDGGRTVTSEFGMPAEVAHDRPGPVPARVVAGPAPVVVPPSPSPSSPTFRQVSPRDLERQRISGDRNIVPADLTKAALDRSGRDRLIVPVRLCVGARGQVETVDLDEGSGFPEYDAKIRADLHGWRFRPVVVDGRATGVCATITLIYLQNRALST